jgi:UDP-N-acetylmuramate dehydrogenase
MELSRNVSLKTLNTFGIDVKARLYGTFQDAKSLGEILAQGNEEQVPFMVLGGGSNMLFTNDFNGLILKNEVKGIGLVREDEKHAFVKAGAGENWHTFVLHCIENGWAGLENLSLIPGNVGASPMQNIGAYGVEVKDRFESLEAYHVASGTVKTFSLEECAFGYRESVFKRKYKDQYIILTVTFKLLKNPEVNISYGAIQVELDALGISNPGIADVSRAVINIRKSKLPNPAELGNAGSFFKNPVVEPKVYEAIAKEFPDAPHYPAPGGMVKLAAGWLIEKAGWKGKRIGQCGMHQNQALVLVNYGGATGEEIYAHSTRVLESIRSTFGVELEREVNIV